MPSFFSKSSEFGTQFWLVCLITFVYFFAFNMILPRLSPYLESLGGKEYLGLVITVFAAAALITRPFSGKLVDEIGRKPIVVFGIIVSIVISFLYSFSNGVMMFLFLRFMHGFSAGCTPTGTTAICSDVVSKNKRGEAMGWVGLCSNIGMGLGPAVGSELSAYYGNDYVVFVVSAFSAVIALLLTFKLKESLSETSTLTLKSFNIKWNEIIEKSVLPQGFIMLLTVCTFGAILTLMEDYVEVFGIKKSGYFFTVFTVVSIAVRFFSRKHSDKYGRVLMMIWGVSFLILANFFIAFASNAPLLFFGGALFGVSTGINSPTIFAWAVDKSNPKLVGRGVSTLFIFLEIGVMVGAFFSALIYSHKPENFRWAFVFTGICAICALLFVVFEYRKERV